MAEHRSFSEWCSRHDRCNETLREILPPELAGVIASYAVWNVRTLGPGDRLDASDSRGVWCRAEVVAVPEAARTEPSPELRISFLGWSADWWFSTTLCGYHLAAPFTIVHPWSAYSAGDYVRIKPHNSRVEVNCLVCTNDATRGLTVRWRDNSLKTFSFTDLEHVGLANNCFLPKNMSSRPGTLFVDPPE